jgi:hypothetical protein
MNTCRPAHERISAALSTRYAELEWGKVGFRPGTDLADRYGVPDDDASNHRDTEAPRQKSKAKVKRQMANLKEPQRHRDTGAKKEVKWQRANGKNHPACSAQGSLSERLCLLPAAYCLLAFLGVSVSRW